MPKNHAQDQRNQSQNDAQKQTTDRATERQKNVPLETTRGVNEKVEKENSNWIDLEEDANDRDIEFGDHDGNEADDNAGKQYNRDRDETFEQWQNRVANKNNPANPSNL